MSIVTYKSPNSICDICGETASAEDIYAIAHCREDHAAKVHLSCAFPDYATLQASHEDLGKALEALLKNPNLYPCEHVSTHRGGTIWSICDDCGEQFADDRGGVPKPHTHPSITQAETTLANAAKLAPTRSGGSGGSGCER